MDAVERRAYDFSEEEITIVRNTFPRLTLLDVGVWEGELDIDATYNGETIQDRFRVGIIATDKYPEELPLMTELGGRTDAIAEKYKLVDRRDLHYNIKTRFACLCVRQEEKKKFPHGSSLVTFIEDLVIPYLYGLSYYDKHGKWPWGEYSHGGLGLLEFYGEGLGPLSKEDVERDALSFRTDDHWKEYDRQLRKPSSERHCICGSEKPIRKCHSLAWKGIIRLHSELKRLDLNTSNLYQRGRARVHF